MTAIKPSKTYPLVNGAYQLFFQFMQGSEVLGLCLLEEGKDSSIKLGNYSVEQGVWLSKNSELQLSETLLAEIITIAKGVAYARSCDYSRAVRLSS